MAVAEIALQREQRQRRIHRRDVTCGRLTYIKFEIWKIAILQTVVTSTVKDASVGKSNNHKPKVAYEQFDGGDAQTILRDEYRANAEGISNRTWRSRRQASG